MSFMKTMKNNGPRIEPCGYIFCEDDVPVSLLRKHADTSHSRDNDE